MNKFFSIYLILSAALGPGVHSNIRNRKIMLLESEVQPVRRADNLAAACEDTKIALRY
jgi:hypothetical protein